VRKIIIGGAAAAMGLATVLAGGASAGGNGAAVSPLSPQAGSLTSQCVEGDGAGGNGFVMLNAPGQPGAASKLIGEVSLKNAQPNTTYMVEVSVGSNNCMPETSLTTNGVGNGNAHIADPTLGSGSFYVVLTDASGNEQYASQTVAVN